MPWWQTAFSSSSSSSKSQCDDSHLGGKQTSKSGIFSRRSGRQITSGKKLRNLTENAVEQLWRSAPSAIEYPTTRSSPAHGTPPSPQPLPLPELQVLLRTHPHSSSSYNSVNIPLPSPRDVISHHFERDRAREREFKADAFNVDNGNGGRLSHEGRRSTEHPDTRTSRRSNRDINGIEKPLENYVYNVPQSAPASPFSSITTLGQHISHGDHPNPHYVTPPACFHVWSAPEMPSADPVTGSTHQISVEKTAFSVDSSPLHSPRISPNRSAKSASVPNSPMPTKTENPMTRRETVPNSQGNVHPLPLPPGNSLSQPAPAPPPVPHLSSIPEVVPMNSQWQKGKLIGRGTFGSVYVASNKETGALCAMKEVELLPDDPKSAESIKQLEQEIKVLSNLQHPNIVQYYGSEIVGDRFYIYLEYVHPGSLTKFIKDHCGAMTESVVRNFTRHILSGLAYLHSTKTIHRDIKGANLLVDAYGVVKLADFGMAKHLNGHRANLSLKGSPYWMAPELLESVIQTDATVDVALAVDIWSLGCTIIEMLSGRPPWSEYEGAAAMFKVLKENPPIPENLSEEARDFLQCCFQRNPAERPTATMLLEHRFLKSSHQQDVQSSSGTRPAENPRRRERPNIKVDQVPVFFDNEPNQRSHFEASKLKAVSHHSPRSTLENLPGLSPPHPRYNMNRSITSGSGLISIEKVVQPQRVGANRSYYSHHC